MRIAVLGTGTVGRALAEGFSTHGHNVAMGTRDVGAALDRPGPRGGPSLREWVQGHPSVEVLAFSDAAAGADAVVNATAGSGSVAALEAAGADDFAGTVVIDVANPLDFSAGFPPTLTVKDTDSLAEVIQRRFPQAHVVKALNTMTADLMAHPELLPEPTTVFLAGDDQAAKDVVRGLLGEFGWTDVLDLGGIASARGLEMWLPLWLRLMGSLGTAAFNLRIVR